MTVDWHGELYYRKTKHYTSELGPKEEWGDPRGKDPLLAAEGWFPEETALLAVKPIDPLPQFDRLGPIVYF